MLSNGAVLTVPQLPDLVVGSVRHIDVSGAVDRQAERTPELAVDSETGACLVAKGAVAGHRDEGAAGRDFSNPVVVGVGDEEISGAVERDGSRGIELSAGGRAAVAAKQQLPFPANVVIVPLLTSRMRLLPESAI